jgi:hypothetical protein
MYVQKKDYINEIKERQRLAPPTYEGSKPKVDLDQSETLARGYWNQERKLRQSERSIPIQLRVAYFKWHATPKCICIPN